MTTMFNAWKKGGKADIMAVLKAMHEKEGETTKEEDARP
jgi:hypothetical protein